MGNRKKTAPVHNLDSQQIDLREIMEVLDGLLEMVFEANQAAGNELEEREQDYYNHGEALLKQLSKISK